MTSHAVGNLEKSDDYSNNGNLYCAHPCIKHAPGLGAEQLKENLLKSILLKYPREKKKLKM